MLKICKSKIYTNSNLKEFRKIHYNFEFLIKRSEIFTKKYKIGDVCKIKLKQMLFSDLGSLVIYYL